MVFGTKQYNQVLRWLGSKPQSVTSQYLDSVDYCYVLYSALPATLVPTLATIRVHPPTWESPVSNPASPPATLVHSPTWSSLVSVPAFRLPNPPFFSPLVPTLWRSLHRSSSEVVYLLPIDSTKPPSWYLPLRTLFSLHTPQIVDVAPPTVPRMPDVSLCRSLTTAFLLPTVCLPYQESPTSPLYHL